MPFKSKELINKLWRQNPCVVSLFPLLLRDLRQNALCIQCTSVDQTAVLFMEYWSAEAVSQLQRKCCRWRTLRYVWNWTQKIAMIISVCLELLSEEVKSVGVLRMLNISSLRTLTLVRTHYNVLLSPAMWQTKWCVYTQFSPFSTKVCVQRLSTSSLCKRCREWNSVAAKVMRIRRDDHRSAIWFYDATVNN